jgi:SAM-dependent methyltransferase
MSIGKLIHLFTAASRIVGFLDSPHFAALSPGNSNEFSGWVFLSDGARVRKVEVVYGDKILGTCEYGLPRADVFVTYPQWDLAKCSGFTGSVMLPQKLLRPIEIYVWDERGRRHNAFEINTRYVSALREPRPEYLVNINRSVHPACEMHRYLKDKESEARATEIYFRYAEFLVYKLARFSDEQGMRTREKTLLDFACGYGRFARYFANLFKEVTVSDLEPEMLDFCRKEFGTMAFLSSNSANVVGNYQARYDVVFCFSLFTHLNEQQWREWFKALFNLVAKQGYLIISTQGHELMAKLNIPPGPENTKAPGFFFSADNETDGRLDPTTYGITVLRDSYVRNVASTIAGMRVVKHYKMGTFDLYHDIYVFQKTMELAAQSNGLPLDCSFEGSTVLASKGSIINSSASTNDLMPPQELMFVGGGVDNFKEIGEAFVRDFQIRCRLKPHERVLDVGCGVGRIAIPLTEFLNSEARYEGLDVVPRGIDWCKKNITSRYSNFHFQLADIYNKHYHPSGKRASKYRFPYDDSSFDFICLASVFTHLLPPDMANYFREISRVLTVGGRCMITFFLLNEESLPALETGKSTLSFDRAFKQYRVHSRQTPEGNVAYNEDYVLRLYEANGLEIEPPLLHGVWSGRTDSGFGGYQDIIIAHKPQAGLLQKAKPFF